MQLDMQNSARKSHSQRMRSIGRTIERKLRFCLVPIGENLAPEYGHVGVFGTGHVVPPLMANDPVVHSFSKTLSWEHLEHTDQHRSC